MIQIRLEDYMSSAFCQSQSYSCKEGFLPITYRFVSTNCYGVISDFGRGSWALTTCLGGRGKEPVSGKIYLNEKTKDIRY